MSEIILRKSIPIIGAISCGKSLFLDNLLGLNLLESKSSTTTKFVCIIRHNKNLSSPKFYHIKLKENEKDQETGMMEYKAVGDDEVIQGYENIKEKIIQINKEQKSLNDNDIKYDELFYVLETKLNNIKNEELLNNYDFYDIPGLDEYIADNNDINNDNDNDKKRRMKYIDNLFKYFRSRVDFGVFILNAESAYTNSSYEVIINVSNILKPKKIKNYLIILNKIDRKSNQNDAINEVKGILVNDLMDQINLADNVLIGLDSRQIKHQNLLKENFEDFLLFLFNQYVVKSVIPFKDGNYGLGSNKTKNKFNTKNYSLANYLFDFIFEQGMTDKEKNSYLNELINQFEQNGLNLKKIGIGDLVEKIKNLENFNIEFDIDMESEESIKLFKALYIIFKNKIKLPFSQQVTDVYDYFSNILDKMKEMKKNKEDNFLPEYILNQENLIDNSFFDRFNQFIRSLESIDDELDEKISLLYNSVFCQQFFYIGIFGMSNTGKSSILNNILGYDILPVYQNECTKRGIIIEYGEEIALYKAKSEIKELNSGENFLIFIKMGKIVTGEKSVKEYLALLNTKYAKNTKLENNEYFIVSLPIKFFDEINIDENLKKIIRFIDLPGSNINSAQNNFSYEEIINSTSLFILNFTNSTIGSVDNTFNKKIYTKFEENDIPCNDALKNILFDINLYQNDELNENNIKLWNKKIKNLIGEVFTEENMDLNLTYINSKSFQYYNKSIIYYCDDYKQFFDDILKLYNDKQEKNCFSEFILGYIKSDIMDAYNFDSKDINEIINDGKYNNEVFKKINNLFKTYSNITVKENNLEKNIKIISSCITFAKNNAKSTKYYKNSFYEKFFNDLSKAIISAKEFKNEYLKKYFNSCVQRFTYFFSYDEEYRILNYTRLFDSFYTIFQSYKKNDFSLPDEMISLKHTIDSKNDYYVKKKEVRGFGPGPTESNSDQIVWSNGITTVSDFPKIYVKQFESRGDGKPFQKIKLIVNQKFDDIIVGWKITDNWKDGTNGSWYMQGNPLLTNKINVEFTSKSFRGEHFSTFVYLMKYPN